MRGDPDSCGVWAPDLSYADGRFHLIFTDVKRYGQTTVDGAKGASLRDFHNYLGVRASGSTATGPIPSTSTAAASTRRCSMTTTAEAGC